MGAPTGPATLCPDPDPGGLGRVGGRVRRLCRVERTRGRGTSGWVALRLNVALSVAAAAAAALFGVAILRIRRTSTETGRVFVVVVVFACESTSTSLNTCFLKI